MPPPSTSLNDDDYVISLLKQDAAANQKRSLTNGLGPLLSKRSTGNAPKPNTRFLKNIIRETDIHNAALKAKEEEDSKAKLRELHGTKRGRDEGGDEGSLKRRRGEEKRDRWAGVLAGLGTGSGGVGKRRKEVSTRTAEERSQRRHRHRDRRYSGEEKSDRRSAARGRDSETVSSQKSPPHRKERRRRSSSRSPTPIKSNHIDDHPHSNSNSDSDPLDSFLGPAPPPKSLPRGRGAFKPSGMDTRFDPAYDPKSDVSLEQDEDRDDWDMALEALRDRAKWRASGAERLRAAGFTEEEIRKSETGVGGGGGGGREKDFEDIRWNNGGEREWDRGKVVREDGHVDVKASWT